MFISVIFYCIKSFSLYFLLPKFVDKMSLCMSFLWCLFWVIKVKIKFNDHSLDLFHLEKTSWKDIQLVVAALENGGCGLRCLVADVVRFLYCTGSLILSICLCLSLSFFLSLCLIFAVVLRVRQSRPEVSARKPFGTDGSVFCRPNDHTGIVLMFSFFFSIFIVIIITVCRNSSYIRVYNSLGSFLHKCCII